MYRVYNAETLQPKTLLRGLASYEWRLDFQGTGACSIAGTGICPARTFDYIVDAGTGDIMVVEHVEHAGGGWQLEGEGAVEMLRWRTIFPRMESLSGQTPELLSQVINANLRGLPFLPVAFTAAGGQYLQTSAIGGTLLDKLHDWCVERMDCGYRAMVDTSVPGKIARLELVTGRDRTVSGDNVLLSTRLGTLALQDVVEDISLYRTKVFVGGQGEGADRVFAAGPDPPPGTPLLEVFVDARNASPEGMSAEDYRQSLLDKLAEMAYERRYTVSVTDDRWGLMAGDTVRLHVAELDVRGTARVSSVKVSGGGVEELKEVTLGTQAWTYKPVRAPI
jgi:hypothetical protein